MINETKDCLLDLPKIHYILFNHYRDIRASGKCQKD